jgi:hypothetical protein
MAKKIPKIPKPRAKTKTSLEDKLYILSSIFSPRSLRGNPASWGSRAWMADQADTATRAASRFGRAGRLGLGSLRFMGLTNPWFAIPAALTGVAKYSVGKAFDPYRDETGKIGAEGHERLLQERLAREERTRANAAARGEKAWFEDPDFRMWGNEGGIARLV